MNDLDFLQTDDLSHKEIEQRILEQVQVDEDIHLEVEETLNILAEKINMDLSSLGVVGRVEKQGSFVRRTYLNEDDSYDLILVLDKNEKTKIHRILDSLVSRLNKDRLRKEPLQVSKITGKIPYLRIIAGGLLVHVFVGFNISPGESQISIFDLMPLHTSYILAHMNNEERQEVLLLKKFTKNIGVYRNEVGAIGFNGYLCELLILFYGSFRATIKAMSRWKPRVLIDLKKNKETIENVDSKTIEMLHGYYPLYVSDPLAPRNNVAADVSVEQFYSIISAANIYLQSPDLNFFLYHPSSLPRFEQLMQKIKDSGRTLLVLSTKRDHQESEVCWQKALTMKKAFNFELERNLYAVDRIKAYITDEKYGIMISLKQSLPKLAIRKEGPFITDSQKSIDFLQKYNAHNDVVSGPFIENHKWVIYFANRGQHAYEFIHSLVRQNTFILEMDSFLKLEIKNKVSIHAMETDLEKFYNHDPDFAESLYFFVERKPSWIYHIAE